MVKTSIEIVGLKEAKSFLKKQNGKKLSRLNETVHKQGFLLEGEVKDSIAGRKSEPTSVDTGRFLNSVSTDNKVKIESRVFSDVSYGPFLEKGTVHITARRHFSNSADRRKSAIVSAIKSAIK